MILAMANLTITLPDDVLKNARIRALEHDTSVNAVLREYLIAYVGATSRYREPTDKILALAKNARSGSGGRSWTRDELHER